MSIIEEDMRDVMDLLCTIRDILCDIRYQNESVINKNNALVDLNIGLRRQELEALEQARENTLNDKD